MEFSKTNEIIYTFLWGVRGEWDISSSILAVDLHLFKGIHNSVIEKKLLFTKIFKLDILYQP